MQSAPSGFAPWNGPMNQQAMYIPAPPRNAYFVPPGLPIPPSYTHQPLTAPQAAMHPSPAPLVAQPQTKRKTEWPQDVRDYVSRCFAPENAIPDIAKADLESRLKRIITDAAHTDQLYTLNWKQMLLPQQMIQDERRRAVLTPQSPLPLPLSSLPVSSMLPGTQFQPQDTLRKRKSSELSTDMNTPGIPPWQNGQQYAPLESRISPAPGHGKRQKQESAKFESKSSAALELRKRRFEDVGTLSPPQRSTPPTQNSLLEPVGPVIGRSQKLEKHYFRLTSAPNPNDVRPLPVLRQTLELLKQKWRDDSNYGYICDQFKSLRQDLTVQRIKNEFTTNVYEIHARIALEKGDLGEYNQCQTQLRALYKQNLGGHPSEFAAYRILYLIHTCNRIDMNDVLSDLTSTDKAQEAVRHALQVRSAIALGNYHQFFKLYLTVPNMGGYLMDMFVGRERLAAMARICKVYKPDVRLRFITEELAFESDEDTARFVLDHNGNSLLQEKEDHVRLLTGKAGQVFEQARQQAFQQVDIKGQI